MVIRMGICICAGFGNKLRTLPGVPDAHSNCKWGNEKRLINLLQEVALEEVLPQSPRSLGERI